MFGSKEVEEVHALEYLAKLEVVDREGHIGGAILTSIIEDLVDCGLEFPDELLSDYLLAIVGRELDIDGHRLRLLFLSGLVFVVPPKRVLVEDIVDFAIPHESLALLLDLGMVLVAALGRFLGGQRLGCRLLAERVQTFVDGYCVIAFLERISIGLGMVRMAQIAFLLLLLQLAG